MATEPATTLTLGQALTHGPYWAVVGITGMLVAAAVYLHYEALERLNFSMPHWKLQPRSRILLMIVTILGVHVAEIWIFGFGIYMATQWPALGHVSGVDHLLLLDAVYMSANTYTTVGYGDLAPLGAIRLIMGTEALTGFVLITWSASFTYLEMQRYWRPR